VAFSVVVPVYNSEGSLPLPMDRLSQALESGRDAGEWILVTDVSHGRNWSLIQEVAARHPRIRGFNRMRNYGQHNALLRGIGEYLERTSRFFGWRPAHSIGLWYHRWSSSPDAAHRT
jgi:glycosyltransferase involved in cell wall biosynthesis